MKWWHIKKHFNLFLRGKVIWLDYQKGSYRMRKSTRLKYSRSAYFFVCRNIEKYLEDNAENELKKEFDTMIDDRVIDKLRQSENSSVDEENVDILYIKNVYDKFYKEKSFLKRSTLINYSAKFAVLYDFFKENHIDYISDFKRADCVLFMEFLVKRGVLNTTINAYFHFLKMFLTFAVENKYIENNPFFKPKRKLDYKRNIEPFNFDEVKLLLKNASGELRLYLYVAFFTGMRVGEILALNWGDIDFENNEIKITKTLSADGFIDTPKTYSSLRNIDMLDILKKELLAVRGDNSDRIFKIAVWSLRKDFNKLVKSLNITKHRLYDCRHTFASLMLSRGEEPLWVGLKMLGHKDLNETFKTYAKYLPKLVKERAKFLENECF